MRLVKHMLLVLLMLLVCTDAHTAEPDTHELIDWPMLVDPDVSRPLEPQWHPRLAELWMQVIEQRVTDQQSLAAGKPAICDAETATRAIHAVTEAHRQHMPGLKHPRLVQNLIRLLDQPDPDRSVRLASVEALTQLDARDAASVVFRLAYNQPRHTDYEMILLADRALGQWDYAQAFQIWIQRLRSSNEPLNLRLSAVEAVRQVRATVATPELLRLMQDDRQPDALRLATARTLGALHTRSMEAPAQQLLTGTPSMLHRLLAASLLVRHDSTQSRTLLARLAVDAESVVAIIAVQRLGKFDPQILLPHLNSLLQNSSAELRQHAVQALGTLGGRDAVDQLGAMLSDPDSHVRNEARHALLQLASAASLREHVIAQAVTALDGQQWSGQEQAALLLGKLEHKAIWPRLVQLLHVKEPSVRVAAATSLRWINEPEALPAMMQAAEQIAQDWQNAAESISASPTDSSTPAFDTHAAELTLAQLFQTLGVMKHEPAKPLLRRFVSKSRVYKSTTRAAAIWALGRLHEDQPDDALAEQFTSRLMDYDNQTAESDVVRRMCAIGLGRMKTRSALSKLETVLEAENRRGETASACRWAIERITGQPQPQLNPSTVPQTGWFLEPLD